MRPITRATSAALACTLLAACGQPTGSEPGKDFWGHRLGRDGDRAACIIPQTDLAGMPKVAPQGGFDEALYTRIAVTVTAERRLENEPDVCVPAIIPFYVHLYGDADGVPGLKMDTGQPLPWDNRGQRLYTPHREWFWVARKAKTWRVRIIATHEGETRDIVRLNCAIFVNGRGVDYDERQIGRTERGTTVRCSWSQ